MVLDRLERQEQLLGDLAVGDAVGGQLGDAALPGGEGPRPRGGAPARPGTEAHEAVARRLLDRAGTDRLGDGEGGLEPGPGVVVAARLLSASPSAVSDRAASTCTEAVTSTSAAWRSSSTRPAGSGSTRAAPCSAIPTVRGTP